MFEKATTILHTCTSMQYQQFYARFFVKHSILHTRTSMLYYSYSQVNTCSPTKRKVVLL